MSKYLKEGESIPFGYGFVAHRFDMLATEVAPLPLNYLIRLIRWWQMKSYKQMTRNELAQLRKVQALIIAAKSEAETKQHAKDMEWFKEVFFEVTNKKVEDGTNQEKPIKEVGDE